MKAVFTEAPEPDAEAAERGRRLFAGPVAFLKGVVAMDGLPPADGVEVTVRAARALVRDALADAV